MATHATNIAAIRNPFAGVGAAIVNWMTALGEARSRHGQIAALEAKTDAELAAMGIRRDMIAHHVFRDLYYV